MSKKKSDKKISFLETIFQDILVCEKNDSRPYMEIFIQRPENVAQENLGTIAGILEITDESEESSYIVNYLISVIKKEFYAKAKRGSVESFEAALHKANLALAKLAEHENIGWVDKINALIIVSEKNNIHLSQVGTTHALLLRGKSLTNISESNPEAESPSPLKTFIDVVSGRLENNDKLIITTGHIFDIFSFEEIKRSALKFSTPEFVQFLKTALGNELPRAAVLIMEAREKEISEMTPAPIKKTEINAWSQKAFSKKSPKIILPDKKTENKLRPEEKHTLISERNLKIDEPAEEFINQKTGHIYIKEDNFAKESGTKWIDLKFFFEENLSRFLSLMARIFSDIPEFGRKIFIKNDSENDLLEKISNSTASTSSAEIIPQKKYIRVQKYAFSVLGFVKTSSRLISEKIKGFIVRSQLYFSQRKLNRKSPDPVPQKSSSLISNMLPSFSKIKNIFSNLDYNQKIYAFLAIILLFVVPYFISKFYPKTASIPETRVETPAIPLPLEKDKNVIRIENLNHLDMGKEILSPINLNDKIFVFSADAIIDPENKNVYPIPTDFSELKTAFGMDDLNLIFLLNGQNKIISLSPITGKFQNNDLIVPEGADIASAKTYLTYLYLLDQKNNQIYRYPRAGNGFGDKINWIKDDLVLDGIRDMAISDNVYLAENSAVIKLFRGKKEDFNLEKTETSILIDKIFTRPDSQNIYLLDKINARILKLDITGNIISQFFSSEISGASGFSVDEKNAKIYFASGNNLVSFNLNQ